MKTYGNFHYHCRKIKLNNRITALDDTYQGCGVEDVRKLFTGFLSVFYYLRDSNGRIIICVYNV